LSPTDAASVRIEATGACGPSGVPITRTIQADQAIVVEAETLPLVREGWDAAIISVESGEAAALVDTVRVDRMAEGGEPPPDWTSAYLAPATELAFDLDALPTVTLGVTTTLVTIGPDSLSATLGIQVAEDTSCGGFRATSGADWLQVRPGLGVAPSEITLTVDPDRLPRDQSGPFETDVRIEPVGATGPAVTVHVVANVPLGATIYLPSTHG
jgi:hypothetical protein